MPKAKSTPKVAKKDAKASKVAAKKADTKVTASKSKSKPVAPVKPAKSPAKATTAGKGKGGRGVPSSPSPAPSPAKPVSNKRVATVLAPTPTKKTPALEKVILKGGAAVDKLVPNTGDFRVHQDTSRVYSATLNQSNLDANNNKFYIIQAIMNEKTNQYYCWNRWGRVGVPGQTALKGPFSAQAAVSEFNSKLRDKTSKGDYKQIEIKFDDGQDDEADKKVDTKGKPKTGTSKMDSRIQKLINLIFDTQIINNTMKQIGYDPQKMPLGKLGDSTIKQAYAVLNNLSKAVKKNDKEQMKKLSSEFYTLIPHDFGFKKMIEFIIDTDEKVKKKLQMLADISDMKITTKLLASSTNNDDDIVDQNYKKLGCNIDAIDKKDKTYQIISDYLHNTKEGWNIDIDEIYKIHRPTQDKSYNSKIKNKMLLWHGSRIANFVGILSQGLRIAPPEAPVSGYLFGKGIYLADMIGKSAGYCRSYGSDTALCLLIQGALGDPNILLNSNYQAKQLMEKAKKNSTKCHGSKAPPESSYVNVDKDIAVPAGKPVATNSGSYMGHNQFIIYDTSQAKIRYVVKMKMK